MSRTGGSSKPPRRVSASATWSRLVASCFSYGSTCHGAPGWGARGSIRSGLGSSSSVRRASANERLALTISARTRSPGTTPRTNTTNPASARPTPAPPWASDSIVTSTCSPLRGRTRAVAGASDMGPMLAGSVWPTG